MLRLLNLVVVVATDTNLKSNETGSRKRRRSSWKLISFKISISYLSALGCDARVRAIISLSTNWMRNKLSNVLERCTINKSSHCIKSPYFIFSFSFLFSFVNSEANDVTISLLFRNVCPSQFAQYIEP